MLPLSLFLLSLYFHSFGGNLLKMEGYAKLYLVIFVCSLASNLLVQLTPSVHWSPIFYVFIITLFTTLLFLYLLILNGIFMKLSKAELFLFLLIFPLIMFFTFWFGLWGYCDLLNLSKTGDCVLVALIVLPVTIAVAVVGPILTILTMRKRC